MPSHTALSRRSFLNLLALGGGGAAIAACGVSASAVTPAVLQPEAPVTGPDQALQRLMEGNERYASNSSTDLNESAARRAEAAKGQQPFATIFSCVDSRVPPELVFDRGLGDLFVIRTAGHVVDNAVLGSLEFGAAELKIPLLMVMGHGKCGAVKATIETLEQHTHAPAQIDALVTAIAPAVEQVREGGGDVLQNAVIANVELTVQKLRTAPLLSDAIAAGKLKVIGAWYNLESGKVELIAA
jgi:carbonic anhydrase